MIPAEVGLSYCNKLFFIERELKDLPADARKEKRLEKETPVWDNFWKWLEGITPAGGSKLEKAVNYARNHRETLCNYLLDGRCEISNNAAERRAKSYAIGRKHSCSIHRKPGPEPALSCTASSKLRNPTT